MRSTLDPRARLALLLMAAGGVALSFLLGRLQIEAKEQLARASVRAELATIAARLEGEVRSTVNLTEGIAHLVQHEGAVTPERFAGLARQAMAENRQIRNIALAPGDVLRYVYPLQGNESILGIDYRTLPDQYPLIERAREIGAGILAGPVNLMQGGRAFIFRRPLFVADRPTDSRRYWGVVSVVAQEAELFEAAGLAELPDLRLALRSLADPGTTAATFWGDAATFSRAPETQRIEVPAGTWQIAAVPHQGWPSERFIDVSAFLAGLAVTTLTLLAFGVLLLRNREIRQQNAAIALEMAEKNDAVAALQQSENRYRRLAEDSSEWIWTLDLTGRHTYCNSALEHILGYKIEEFSAIDPATLVHPDDLPVFRNAFATAIARQQGWRNVEIRWKTQQGGYRTLESNASPIFDADGQLQGFQGVDRDISDQKEYQLRLEHVAHFDALTDLPNRVLLADRMQQAMVQARRRGNQLLVAYIDLDGFKAINDRHGHETGDRLLLAVAEKMKLSLREGDTIARLGGDEFVALLIDIDDASGSLKLVQRLLHAAEQPIRIESTELQVSASIGVTFYPQEEAVDADQLLRQADQAMYQAKLAGRNRYHAFDAEEDRSARGRIEGLERIRRALEQREFVLHYQPKVNMRTGAVIGAEALIRWQHPERGLLPPGEFLPMIENHPLSIDIGEWVIATALAQIGTWKSAGLNLPVSVNIGARQLQQPGFFARLRALLAQQPQVAPSSLGLEVLETSALEDLLHVSRVIDACRDIGLLFALDDFGTGYSSLTYLKRLRVAQLKIDQTFVRNMLVDPDDLAILEGVLGLADAFRRDVIAEGVETLEHGELLLQLGCEQAQGYGIARPMPGDRIPDWVGGWRADLRWLNRRQVSRDALPILFAIVEHRAWAAALAAHLQGDGPLPALDPHQCRFGNWLDSDGRERYGALPSFPAVEDLHARVHALARQLNQPAAGQEDELPARMQALDALRLELAGALQSLVREASGQRDDAGWIV